MQLMHIQQRPYIRNSQLTQCSLFLSYFLNDTDNCCLILVLGNSTDTSAVILQEKMSTLVLFQMGIQVKPGSAPFWKKAIKLTYPTVIIGSQRRNSFMQVGGQASRASTTLSTRQEDCNSRASTTGPSRYHRSIGCNSRASTTVNQ